MIGFTGLFKHNRSLKVAVQGPDFWPTPSTYWTLFIQRVTTRLFAKPLLSNGCCIFAYLAVVKQRVYIPQQINGASG
jgi:hypothetical protein